MEETFDYTNPELSWIDSLDWDKFLSGGCLNGVLIIPIFAIWKKQDWDGIEIEVQKNNTQQLNNTRYMQRRW